MGSMDSILTTGRARCRDPFPDSALPVSQCTSCGVAVEAVTNAGRTYWRHRARRRPAGPIVAAPRCGCGCEASDHSRQGRRRCYRCALEARPACPGYTPVTAPAAVELARFGRGGAR